MPQAGVCCRVSLGSIVHADEGSHRDILHAVFDTRRIDHTEMYSDGDACANRAESYFSRLRRAVTGQHHHVSPQYLYQFANEAAWREDHCRTDNGGQFKRLADTSLHSPVSRVWKGYWQRAALFFNDSQMHLDALYMNHELCAGYP